MSSHSWKEKRLYLISHLASNWNLCTWLTSVAYLVAVSKLRPKGILGQQLMRRILFIMNIAALEIDWSYRTKHFFTSHVCVFLQTLSKWLEYHLPRVPFGLNFDDSTFWTRRPSIRCIQYWVQCIVVLQMDSEFFWKAWKCDICWWL